MNMNDLKYYVSLSTEKNFSKVAQDYSVSQPTISAAIKRLEAAFGSQLLVRGKPTPGNYPDDCGGATVSSCK